MTFASRCEYIPRTRWLLWLIGLGGLLAGLYLTSIHSYLLFHNFAELFSIIIVGALFVVSWNTRTYTDAPELVYLGIAYLFIGLLDLLHTLSYKGMNIFTDYAFYANQFWIGARYLQSFTLLLFAGLAGRIKRVSYPAAFLGYGALAALLTLSILTWKIFPICFVQTAADGRGYQTAFKIVSEYVVCGIFLAAALLLRRQRQTFAPAVSRLLFWSILATIGSELCFTLYISNYGFSNQIGHDLKIAAFYLVYRAIIATGLRQPVNLLFRNLQAQEELMRQERDRVRQYLDIAGVILVVLDRGQQVCVINAKGCAVLGWQAEELIGRNWFDAFVPDADRERARAAFYQLMAGAVAPVAYFENAILTRSGAERLIAWHNTLLQDAAGRITGTLSSGEDITERKRAAEALRESEKKFYSAFHFNPMVMSLSTLIDGRFLDVNDEFLNMAERPRDEVIGHTSLEIQAWGSPAQREQIISRLREHGTVRDVEVTVRAKSGKRHEVLWSAEHLVMNGEACLLAAAVDITERKQAEEEINRTKAHLAAFVKNTPAAVAMFDTNLHYIAYSQKWLQDYNLGEQDLTGRHHYDVFPEIRQMPFWMDVHNRCLAGETIQQEEDSFNRTDGRKHWLFWEVKPWFNENGAIGGIIMITMDITARKQAEDALRAAHAELLEKNIALHEANASKDKFFSIIAHDLRSPFNGLLGYIDLMDRQSGDLSVNKLKDYLAKLKLSANALYALLENLLAWARLQRGLVEYRPEVIALAPLVNEIVGLFAANAGQKAITLTQAIPAAVMVSADSAMLNTILRNLLSNALKFTPAGGRITLAARLAAPDVEIAVTDTGCGMTPEVLAQLFRIDSHHTTKGTAGETGTGLGLLLCHDLVRKHGGRLWGESAVGVGTTFRFTLPLASTTAAPEPPAASAAAAPFDFAQGDTGILTRLTAPLPPAQTLETLLACAEIGDILELRNALDALAQEAPLIPFVSSLNSLAEQFKMDAIRQLLEGYLAQANEKETTSGR